MTGKETKTFEMEAVVVHVGSRSFMGTTPLSRDEFDRRCSTGRAVDIHGAFELRHASTTTDDGEMQNLVSMTSIDHLYGAARRLPVKPSSWYFVDEQGELNGHIYRTLYADTTRRQRQRTEALVSSLEAAQKEAEEGAAESEETAT